MSNTLDSSHASWHAQTLSAAEGYDNQHGVSEFSKEVHVAVDGPFVATDGVDTPSGRAQEAFWGHDPNRPGSSSSEAVDGRTYLAPEEVQTYRDLGFVVETDGNGQAYLPPQAGHDQHTQSPSWNNLPAPDQPGQVPSAQQPPPTVHPDSPSTGIAGGVHEPNDAGAPGEPDKITTGMGAEVDGIINKSPTLRQLWHDAKAAGWEIKFVEGGKGSQADPKTKEVSINLGDIRNKDDLSEKIVSLLAHEIGHAATPFKPIEDASTRQEFIDKNTANAMEHEGAAAFANARARDEILNNGGPDIGIRGGFDPEYIALYEDWKASQGGPNPMSEAEAIAIMTTWMAAEPQRERPDGSFMSKAEVAEEKLGQQWDERHPQQ